MPEFLNLSPPKEALDKFLEAIPDDLILQSETIPTDQSLHRVLAAAVIAPHPLPAFARSTVDGYAVLASDTHGASSSLPAYLHLMGEVSMGQAAYVEVSKTEAALVHTGGMIPEGANAVVMIEDTQLVREGEIEVYKAVAVGQNVLQVSEDVQEGETVVEPGFKIRAQEIGGLLALGVTEVEVTRQPRVGILSTGDEVIPPDEQPGPAQVRDINSFTLSALIDKAGGLPIRRGIIPDQFDTLLKAAQQAHQEDDVVIITAGSSVSVRDLTADVIEALGKPGVLVHGISIKPGKPTILAVADRVPIIGLPGNPVSALVVAGLFLTPLIHHLLGLRGQIAIPKMKAKLSENIPSASGREDYLPVKVVVTKEGILAEPVFGRSNLIFTLVRADGLVRIPPEVTGLAKDAEVEIQLF